MKPYVSIDIETTGLDPETCQILSIGAVIDDWKTSVTELKTFHGYIDHQQFTGTACALAMHGAIFQAIHDDGDEDVIVYHPDDLASEFENWLSYHQVAPYVEKLTIAGKNYGGFDHQFLKRLPNWTSIVRTHHRCIDPGNLFFDPEIDDVPPSMEVCMRRAGLEGVVAHTALEDAQMVVRLVRYWAAKLKLQGKILARASHDLSACGVPNGS